MNDSDKPTLVMMVGLVGSGKSTYAMQLTENTSVPVTVFSSDVLREQMFGNVDNQENNQKLFQELHKRIKECLKSGGSAIYDATNISSKRRRAFLNELKNIDCYKECVIMATPYKQCLENNRNRDRVVPEWVIERMYRKWQTPHWFEGWDYISVQWLNATWWSNDIGDFLQYCMNFNQDNPHHDLMLGGHLAVSGCIYTREHSDDADSDVYFACLLHDCGKLYCKTFKNSKGDDSNVAHYYNHEHVGAYESLFFNYPLEVNVINVSALITWHMQPYSWERDGNEKLHKKYKKIWGEEFYNCVMALHEADKAAH